MKSINIHIVINLIILCMLIIGAIFLYTPLLNMKVKNCNSVLSVDYEVGTDEVTSCLRFQNYPFMYFGLKYIVIIPLIWICISLLQVMVYIAWEM